MDALRTISTGLENAQNNIRAVQGIAMPRERDGGQPLRSEQQSGATPSVQVNLSDEARAAARSGAPSPPPAPPVKTPAVPVQTQEVVVRAESVGNTGRVEAQDAAASTASSREAVQRYMENARLPAGQSAPSSVRVSA